MEERGRWVEVVAVVEGKGEMWVEGFVVTEKRAIQKNKMLGKFLILTVLHFPCGSARGKLSVHCHPRARPIASKMARASCCGALQCNILDGALSSLPSSLSASPSLLLPSSFVWFCPSTSLLSICVVWGGCV